MRADAAFTTNLAPDLGRWLKVEIAACSVHGAFRPFPDGFELFRFARAKEVSGLLHGAFESEWANVVSPAFEQSGFEVASEYFVS